MLLSYAIQHEKEGWRVWVDTLSILHSKVKTKFPGILIKHKPEIVILVKKMFQNNTMTNFTT